MPRHSRPLASIGVACAVSAAALVPADEPKAALPRGVTVTTETTVTVVGATGKVVTKDLVTKEVQVIPAQVREMRKEAAPAAFPQGVVVEKRAVIHNAIVVPQQVNE